MRRTGELQIQATNLDASYQTAIDAYDRAIDV
jgi:hypothetical protein